MCVTGAGSKPHWNESFLFTICDSATELNLRLMDKDTFTSDDFLGETRLVKNLLTIVASYKFSSDWIKSKNVANTLY